MIPSKCGILNFIHNNFDYKSVGTN